MLRLRTAQKDFVGLLIVVGIVTVIAFATDDRDLHAGPPDVDVSIVDPRIETCGEVYDHLKRVGNQGHSLVEINGHLLKMEPPMGLESQIEVAKLEIRTPDLQKELARTVAKFPGARIWIDIDPRASSRKLFSILDWLNQRNKPYWIAGARPGVRSHGRNHIIFYLPDFSR